MNNKILSVVLLTGVIVGILTAPVSLLSGPRVKNQSSGGTPPDQTIYLAPLQVYVPEGRPEYICKLIAKNELSNVTSYEWKSTQFFPFKAASEQEAINVCRDFMSSDFITGAVCEAGRKEGSTRTYVETTLTRFPSTPIPAPEVLQDIRCLFGTEVDTDRLGDMIEH